jgi:VWFA-related protein
VQVSVVVQDGNGRPVPGLTADDFEIHENGKAQRVAHFAAPGAAPPRAPLLATGANTFTNTLGGRDATGATIILFDRLNTRTLNQTQARRAVIGFLQQLAPGDRIGFYVLESDRIDILHDFTTDASSLLTALARSASSVSGARVASDDTLARPEPRGGSEEEAKAESRMEEWLDRAEGALQDFNFQRRVKATTAALEVLAQRLAGVQGRKHVIWLSDGLPLFVPAATLTFREMDEHVRRATRALSHADIALYPVDTEGLVADVFGYSADRERPYAQARPFTPAFDTSVMLAEQTGGRAFRNTNDLRAALARASDDSRATYLLGYYPVDENWDGKFRNIVVRVARRGVQVRHRSGYQAHPPLPLDTEIRKTGLIEGMAQPAEATAVGLSVRMERSGPGTFAVAMQIDPTTVILEQQQDRWIGNVELAIAQRLEDGSLSSSAYVNVPIEFTPQIRQRFLSTGLTVNRTITLQADARQVVFGARDLLSGSIGTVFVDASRLRHVP